MTHFLASILALNASILLDDPAQPRRVEELDIRAAGVSPAAAAAPSFQEGAFLAERPGTLYKTGQGNLVFVADEAPAGSAAPVSGPIAFLPCEALGILETLCSISSNSDAPAPSAATSSPELKSLQLEPVKRLKVSGQLFRFHGQPYVLLSVVPVEAAPADAPPSPASPTTEGSKPAATPKTAQDLIGELETRRTTPRAMEAAAIAVAPADERRATKESAGERVKSARHKEGEQLSSRQGRIVRHDSWLVFTPDSGVGAEGKNESDAPIVLLACKQLERLEHLAKEVGDTARYTVSGRVTTYRGRNYLLPMLVQVMPPSDLASHQ